MSNRAGAQHASLNRAIEVYENAETKKVEYGKGGHIAPHLTSVLDTVLIWSTLLLTIYCNTKNRLLNSIFKSTFPSEHILHEYQSSSSHCLLSGHSAIGPNTTSII